MFQNPVFGSQEFFERFQRGLLGWHEHRVRRRAAYAPRDMPAPAPPVGPATAPAATAGPVSGAVLVGYQQVQGRNIPVYMNSADLAMATMQAAAPTADASPPPHAPPSPAAAAPSSAPTAPASPPPATPSPAAPASPSPAPPSASAVKPPGFSAEEVEASAPPRAPSVRQGATLDLPPPTLRSLARGPEERADELERILAQHRTEMETAETRHTTTVQGILTQHRTEMEAVKARHVATIEGTLAQHRAEMEAAEVRHATAAQAASVEQQRVLAELLAQHREAMREQTRPAADTARAFAELRELLADQARVMKDEHDRTAEANHALAEMITNLGEIVNGFGALMAERAAPSFPVPVRRPQVVGESAAPQQPAAAPSSKLTASVLRPNLTTWKPSACAPVTTEPELVAAPATTAALAPEDPQTYDTAPAEAAALAPSTPPPAAQVSAPASGASPPQPVATPAPSASPPAAPPASGASPPQPAAAPAPSAPSPTAQVAAPARPLAVVHDAETTRGTPPPARRTVLSTLETASHATASVASVSMSLLSLLATPPPVTASASMTPAQRRAAEEARQLAHIHDSIADDEDPHG